MPQKPASKTRQRVVTGYAQMWPRTIFDLRRNGQLLKEGGEKLNAPGVYVLYRDDQPHYIGKTKRPLWERLYSHANVTNDRLYNWNFFSAFEVPEALHRDELEAVLIAALPTANSASPKISPITLPRPLIQILAKRREIDVTTLLRRG